MVRVWWRGATAPGSLIGASRIYSRFTFKVMTPLDSPEEEKSEEPPKGFFEYWLSPVGNFLMGGAMIGIGAFLSFYTALVGVAFLIIGLARLFWEGFTARDRRSKR